MTHLVPPPGHSSWLDYAVDCMDTRSLEQEELWIDEPAHRHWPEGTTREQMQQAVRDELADLRSRAISDPLEAPPLEKLRRYEQSSTHLMPFKNRAAIEEAGTCFCYHCLSRFQSERVTHWTDDGATALCPICGVDAILADNSDQPISLESLIDYWKDEFGIDGLPQEHEVAKVRSRLEQINELKEQLANDLPQFLSANYPLFVETIKYHSSDATLDEIAKWLLNDNAKRLGQLLSGDVQGLFEEVMKAEAGAYQ